MSENNWFSAFIFFFYLGMPIMVNLDSSILLLPVLHMILLITFSLLIFNEIGWFKTRRTPICIDEWAILQSSASAAMTFWLGAIAAIVALLALDPISENSFLSALLVSLAYNVLLSGVPALIPLSSNIFVEMRGTKKTPMYKPLALAWLLLTFSLIEIAVVVFIIVIELAIK